MKSILFALAGSAIFAVAAASAPAAAMPIPATPIGTINNVEQVQWGHPGWHGHPHWHGHHRRCWNERVVRHDRWGRRFVTTRRVCR